MGIDDQKKQNSYFRKVAHLEFTLNCDFRLSHHGNCSLPLKKTFSCQKCDYEINSCAPFSLFQNKIDKVIHNSLICTTIFRAKYWPWGRPDWGEGIPYGNTTNPDFPFWKVETVDFIERRLIKEPYWWYSKNVIDGTHNEKGNNCCDFRNFFIFLQYSKSLNIGNLNIGILAYRDFFNGNYIVKVSLITRKNSITVIFPGKSQYSRLISAL